MEACLGIARSKITWVMWPNVKGMSESSAAEYGYAIALRDVCASSKQVIVTGRRSHECIITALANYRNVTDEAGMHELIALAKLMV